MAKNPAPSLKFLLNHPAHLIACGFGSGLSPIAPGTAGTLFSWATYGLLRDGMPADWLFGLFLLATYVIGVLACQITGRALGVIDHGSIVWDEIVPFWAVLMLTPAGWAWQLTAFLAFRFFDITKPPPANYFDEQVKNGFGVMTDDVMAAGYTVLTLAIIKSLLDSWL